MFNEGSIKHKQWPKNYQGRSAKKDREDKNGFKWQTKKNSGVNVSYILIQEEVQFHLLQLYHYSVFVCYSVKEEGYKPHIKYLQSCHHEVLPLQTKHIVFKTIL